MAMDSKITALNAAADTYLTALADYWNDLTVGHNVHFVGITNFKTDGLAAGTADNEDGTGLGGITTTQARQIRINVAVKKTDGDSTTVSNKYLIGARPIAELLGALPLVWKVWSDGVQAQSATSPGDTAGY